MNSNIVAANSMIEIPLDSLEIAEILFAAISPETKSGPSDRATTRVSLRESVLVIEVEASDITALRAAMNSYISWVSACIKSIKQIG